MKILAQWTRTSAQGWEEFDSADWGRTLSRPAPAPGGTAAGPVETLDNQPGWVSALNVQGVVFSGYDHYHVEDVGDGSTRVTAWIDDSEDYEPDMHHGCVWTIKPLGPDAKHGDRISTFQSQVIYAASALRARYDYYCPRGIQNGEIRDWSEFVPPNPSEVRHGIWAPDLVHEEHESKRPIRGWREWTEGLDASELEPRRCDDGVVRPYVKMQRPQGRFVRNPGTKTFYAWNGVSTPSAIHAPITGTDEYGFVRFLTRAESSQASGTITGNSDGIAFVFTTAANEPDDASWATGNYRFNLDVPSVGAAITYGLLDQGGSVGHFARVNAGLTADQETKQQSEGAFSGVGPLTATTGVVSWSTGVASDRFEAVLTIARPVNHGNQSITMDLNGADDFADGPWESTLEDTIAVTDEVTTQPTFERKLSDSIVIADDVDVVKEAGGQEFVRSPTDAMVVTDQVIVELFADRAASDAIVVADQTTAGLEVDVALTDAVVVADQTATEMSFDRDLSDAAVVADQLEREADYLRTATDAVVVADQTAAGLDVERTASDAIVVADQTATEMDFLRTPTDVVVVADQTATEADFLREPTDAIVAADQTATEMDFLREASDAAVVADQTTVEVLQQIDVAVSDAIVASDQVATEMDFLREPTDDVVIADQTATEMDFLRIISDSLVAGDDVTAELVSAGRIFTQTDVAANCGAIVACSGAVLATNTMPRECTEGATPGSTPVIVTIPASSSGRAGIMFQMPVGSGATSWPAGNWVVRINHTANILAGVTWEEIYICRVNTVCGTVSTIGSLTGIGQSVTALDVYERTVAGAASSGDPEDMFYIVCVFDNSQGVSRTLQWTPDQDIDTPIVDTEYTRAASDAIVVADQTATEMDFLRTPADAIVVADQLEREADYLRALTDAIIVADQTAAGLNLEVDLTDSVSVSDQALIEKTIGVEISDSVSVTDQLEREADYLRAFTDAVSVSDQIAAGLIFERSITDAISVTDQVAVGAVVEILVSISDAIAVVDAVVAGNILGVALSDTASVTDQVAAGLEIVRTLSDAIVMTDQATATFVLPFNPAHVFTGTLTIKHTDEGELTIFHTDEGEF